MEFLLPINFKGDKYQWIKDVFFILVTETWCSPVVPYSELKIQWWSRRDYIHFSKYGDHDIPLLLKLFTLNVSFVTETYLHCWKIICIVARYKSGGKTKCVLMYKLSSQTLLEYYNFILNSVRMKDNLRLQLVKKWLHCIVGTNCTLNNKSWCNKLEF